MRISKIDNRINFTAGKVELYTDFDGTYCPAKHSSLHNPSKNGFMTEYCDRIDKFFKATEGDLHFNITTGRTFGEYESVSRLLKMRNFKLPFPETVITKDGSDRLVKNGTDNDFYEKGLFPYSLNNTYKAKENHIKELTNWDGDAIHREVRRLADKYKIRFVEGDTENSVFDYGERSLFSEGKLNPDEWKRLPSENGNILQHQTPIADYSLGARKDGKLKLNFIFSPDYGFCPERNGIYDSFMNDLKTYFSTKNIHHHIKWEPASNSNKYRISCSITPEFEHGELTKLYDSKEAVKKALKNNDIVIAAGDGSNDFEMLNPLKYLDKDYIKECEKNSTHKKFYNQDMHKTLKDLQKVYSKDNSDYIKTLRQELTDNGFLRKLEELPIYSIVINKKNTKLQPLIDTFSHIGKVITVESGKLDEGIKKAIQNHASVNKQFRESMSEKFHEFIFGTTKNSTGKYKILKITSATILASVFGYAGYKYLIKTKDAKNGNSTNSISSATQKE